MQTALCETQPHPDDLKRCLTNSGSESVLCLRKTRSPMRILVADETRANRILLAKILGPWGPCAVASSGRLAVDMFRASLDERRPYDLVWLEIMMPDMGGVRALELIREEEERHGLASDDHSKVVMTTTIDDIQNASQAFSNQCDLYLTKPFSPNTIREEMEHLGFGQGTAPNRCGPTDYPNGSRPHDGSPLQIGPETFRDYTSFAKGSCRVIRRVM